MAMTEPLVDPVPGYAAFRQNHRLAAPLRFAAEAITRLTGWSNKQQRGAVDGAKGYAHRQVGRAGGDGDLLATALYPGDGMLGVAGMQLDLHARVELAKPAQQRIEKAVAGGDRAVHADLSLQFAGAFEQ